MCKRILASLSIILFFQLSYAQQDVGVIADNSYNHCRVERYVTDIRRVADNAEEIAVNILFYVTDGEEVGEFAFVTPVSDKITVGSCWIRVYDLQGELLQKQRIKKTPLEQIKKFNPKRFVSKFDLKNKAVKVELDFKLIAFNPEGSYAWPSINTSAEIIEEVSLRLNYDEADDFEFDSNLNVEQEKDVNTGGFYYLWSIKKLTHSGGEFNGVMVKSPYVKILLKSDYFLKTVASLFGPTDTMVIGTPVSFSIKWM
jgi:hypothetical protein